MIKRDSLTLAQLISLCLLEGPRRDVGSVPWGSIPQLSIITAVKQFPLPIGQGTRETGPELTPGTTADPCKIRQTRELMVGVAQTMTLSPSHPSPSHPHTLTCLSFKCDVKRLKPALDGSDIVKFLICGLQEVVTGDGVKCQPMKTSTVDVCMFSVLCVWCVMRISCYRFIRS